MEPWLSTPSSPHHVVCWLLRVALVRCGDLYGDKAVDTFNACAVSDKKCVPQRADEGLYPVPPECALDTKFDLNGFTGRWYITAGLNPLFDIFDCQVRLRQDVPQLLSSAGNVCAAGAPIARQAARRMACF